MKRRPGFTPKRRLPWILFLGIGIVAAALFTGAGFAFAATQESHDPFCASCHTQPESTFFQRSRGSSPVDLASFHTAQQAHCIDCHSGEGIQGRLKAELEGAGNAFKWITGTAVQPAIVHMPIADQNCTKCHQNVTQRGFTPKEQITIPGGVSGRREREGRNNHWHEFLSRWQSSAPDSGKCTSCHAGHSTEGNAASGFMKTQQVQSVCDACHRVLRRD